MKIMLMTSVTVAHQDLTLKHALLSKNKKLNDFAKILSKKGVQLFKWLNNTATSLKTLKADNKETEDLVQYNNPPTRQCTLNNGWKSYKKNRNLSKNKFKGRRLICFKQRVCRQGQSK